MHFLKQKILKTDFPRFMKRFLLLSVLAVLLGGVVTGLCFRTQLSEGISYVRQREEDDAGAGGHDREETSGRMDSERDDRHEHRDRDFLEKIPMTKPTRGAKCVLAAYGCLCVLLFAVYWLVSAAWLCQSAVRANMSGAMWLLAGLVGNLPAAVLFILVRECVRRRCPSCGRWLPKAARFCARCGRGQYVLCPACGEACGHADRYCSSCGHSLPEVSDGASE